MRRLTNKKADEKTTYSDLLKVIINSVPQQGLTIGEQRDRIKLLNKVEAEAEEDMLLEEAEANQLKAMVSEHKWAIVSKELVVFGDDVENMEEVSLKAVKDQDKKSKK